MLPNLLRDPRRNVLHHGIHIRGYTQLFNLGLAGSPQPWRGGLQSPNMTVTLVSITLPCEAWNFTKGFKLAHHIRE
jgi:hypothetical protein